MIGRRFDDSQLRGVFSPQREQRQAAAVFLELTAVVRQRGRTLNKKKHRSETDRGGGVMLARLALAGVLASVVAGPAFAQADRPQSGVGFPSVAAALEAVKAKPGMRVSVQDGWTVIEDRAAMSVWSFTPAGHPAHPTVARREVKQAKDGSISIQQSVLCQAQKPACDKINAEFVELNNRMRRAIERDGPRPDKLPPARAN